MNSFKRFYIEVPTDHSCGDYSLKLNDKDIPCYKLLNNFKALETQRRETK